MRRARRPRHARRDGKPQRVGRRRHRAVRAHPLLNGLARVALGAIGLAGAAVMLLPAFVAALIGLLDLSAHVVLGTSGSLLGIAGGLLPGGGGAGGLPPYAAVAVHPGTAALGAVLRAVPPLCLLAIAVRPRAGRIAVAVAVVSLVAEVTLWAKGALPP